MRYFSAEIILEQLTSTNCLLSAGNGVGQWGMTFTFCRNARVEARFLPSWDTTESLYQPTAWVWYLKYIQCLTAKCVCGWKCIYILWNIIRSRICTVYLCRYETKCSAQSVRSSLFLSLRLYFNSTPDSKCRLDTVLFGYSKGRLGLLLNMVPIHDDRYKMVG